MSIVLDEGVPPAVGEVFKLRGHELIPLRSIIPLGSDDALVWTAVQVNDAVLIAHDRDARHGALERTSRNERYSKLDLIQLTCPELMAHKRVEFAMSFIEDEYALAKDKRSRRFMVEIATHFLKTYR